MKLLLPSILAAALVIFLFSLSASQANAYCNEENMTGDCSDTNNVKVGDPGHEDNDNLDDDTLGPCAESGCYADAPNDKSEVPPGDNDPCNFDGLNVCDKNGDCDNEHVDCATDLGNGKYCTTGMCPGDDDKTCWVNQKFVGCDNNNKKGDGGNHKSLDDQSQSRHHTGDGTETHHNSDSGKKFTVHVNLIYLNGVGGQHKFRVIVYGPHTLNKPTLDKPGYSFKLEQCDDDHCRFDLGTVSFTSWKVPKDSSFKACVWPSTSSEKSCATGKATSRSVDITVTARD